MMHRLILPVCRVFAILISLIPLRSPAEEVISYTTPPNDVPFSWHAGKRIHGLCNTLTERFFKQHNITPEPFIAPWKRSLISMKSGQSDLVCGAYKTPERLEYLNYSVPFASQKVAIFQRRGSPFPYTQWSDLIPHTGVTTIGESWGAEFDQYIKDNLTIILVNDVTQSMKMLINGRAEYAIDTLYSGLVHAEDNGILNRIKLADRNIAEEQLYFAFSKKSPFNYLLPDLNQWLSKDTTRQFITDEIEQFERRLYSDE